MSDYGVLFLCIHNAGRSQMAAAFTAKWAVPGVRVFSAGSEPAHQVNPVAAQAMREVGIPIEDAEPKRWTMEMLEDVDAVVSMGCGDECPVLPGKLRVDWDLADPAGRDIEFVRVVRDDIADRVRGFLSERGLLA
jgi:arsenate reductase (thioredoxin)